MSTLHSYVHQDAHLLDLLTNYFGSPFGNRGINAANPTRPETQAYRKGFDSARLIAPDGYRVQFTDRIARNEFYRGRQDGLLGLMGAGTAEYKSGIARVTAEGKASASTTGESAKNPYTRFSLANAWTRGHEEGLREQRALKLKEKHNALFGPALLADAEQITLGRLRATLLGKHGFIVDDPFFKRAGHFSLSATPINHAGIPVSNQPTPVEAPKPTPVEAPKPTPVVREIQNHPLEMLTPSVNPGLNITVRSGVHWLKARPGDRLSIYKTGNY